MDFIQVANGDVSLNVAVKGTGPVILCVHGWPELWYSWRYQMDYLFIDLISSSMRADSEYINVQRLFRAIPNNANISIDPRRKTWTKLFRIDFMGS